MFLTPPYPTPHIEHTLQGMFNMFDTLLNPVMIVLRVPRSESLKCGKLRADTLECLGAGCAQNKGA